MLATVTSGSVRTVTPLPEASARPLSSLPTRKSISLVEAEASTGTLIATLFALMYAKSCRNAAPRSLNASPGADAISVVRAGSVLISSVPTAVRG
ncbi:MAG: hypothetical protein BWX70_02678 [Verrucomicrobia bacterium ADurb.Bin070]|nr:MAG: hypothetical protein BWX70_02678 [Verrucomicrobia bacterium ADurb.Bin070]